MSDSTAALTTELLRTSSDPLFRRLRELLPAHDIDVATDVLADLFPDDGAQDFGIVVTSSREVFAFVLHHGRTGDLNTQAATAVLAEWTDISSGWEASPYASSVRDALEFLEAQQAIDDSEHRLS